ncbi:MAG: DNA methyltransferase, partial [Acidimicrobiales bacterium]
MTLDELERRLDPDNPKDHDVGALMESFQQFGYVNPIAINEDTGLVIYGHGRIAAARAAFDAGQDPPDRIWDDGHIWNLMVVRGIHLPAAKGKAYLIADNRQMELGGWNEPKRLALLDNSRGDGSVWEASKLIGGPGFGKRRERWHPTEKPIPLAEKAIQNSSRVGELVIDGFLGGGTTMIAAEQQGRLCNGIELEPKYAA